MQLRACALVIVLCYLFGDGVRNSVSSSQPTVWPALGRSGQGSQEAQVVPGKRIHTGSVFPLPKPQIMSFWDCDILVTGHCLPCGKLHTVLPGHGPEHAFTWPRNMSAAETLKPQPSLAFKSLQICPQATFTARFLTYSACTFDTSPTTLSSPSSSQTSPVLPP